MLKFIRRNATGAWVKIMFVAIVVVFVFWGVGNVVRGEKAELVASVNGDAIPPTEFYRAYNNMLRTYQDIYRDNFSPEMAKMLDLKGRTVDQLIQVRLLRQEAERIGLRTSETEVRDAIASMPVFQQDGRFSKDLYVRVLRANNLTPAEFEEAEGDELLVRKLQDLVFAGVNIGAAEVRDQYRLQNERVDLRYLKFDPTAFVADVQVSDADVQAYYDAHKETFRDPERVRIEYVLYAPEQFADKVEVTDADIQKYYDEHQSQYSTPEQVRARHILFKLPAGASAEKTAEVRKRAEDVLAKVKAGDDFAELAKQNSEDGSAAQGGDLGAVTRGQTVKPFEEAAFALAPGTNSDIVQSQFGFHIIKVDSRQEASSKPLADVRDDVAKLLRQQKARDAAQAQATQDQAKAAGGESLASLATASGRSVATPPPFASTDAIEGLGRVAEITTAAGPLSAGQAGPVVTTPNGSVVFRVVEKIESHVPDLATIRERVETALRTERAAAVAKTKAEEARTEVQSGTIDTVAAKYNLTVEDTGPFTRQAAVPKIGNSADLKKAAFQLTADKPVAPQVYTVDSGIFVVVLKERVPADDAKFDTDKDTLMRQAEERRKGQALQEFVNHLKAQSAVEIDEVFMAKVTETGHPLDASPRRR